MQQILDFQKLVTTGNEAVAMLSTTSNNCV